VVSDCSAGLVCGDCLCGPVSGGVPGFGLPPSLPGGGPPCPRPGLLSLLGGGSPPCLCPWLPAWAGFSCPSVPVPPGWDRWQEAAILSAPPAPSARAFDVAASSFLCLSAPLRALDARHRSSLTGSVIAVDPGSPAGLAPWPSVVAPPASAFPVCGAGCRPGLGIASVPVAKILRAASRMGSGTCPVAAAAMPPVDRAPTATATTSPVRRRRPALPTPRGTATRRGRVTARSSASAASQPASSAGLGAATVAANNAATSAYPGGAWSGESSPSSSRSAVPRLGPADPDLGWRADA
jgi:hypothetical protein